MTRARKELISVSDTPYYHCVSRCVRRAFICGEDYTTGRNFDHRKVWLVERMKYLASIFAIDVCAYSAMSNHYHVVLFINQEDVNSWSTEELLERWGTLFPNRASQLRSLINNARSKEEKDFHAQKIEQLRENLADISWFMRCLNEYMARMANKEDDCKGRFWEGRFKSQALLDMKALLSCMAYVDLNPVRAGVADTPEDSDFTSIQERIKHHAQCLPKEKRSNKQKQLIRHHQRYFKEQRETDWSQAKLKPLDGSARTPLSKGIPFTQQEYFQLLDWTGRSVRQDKRHAIPNHLPPILDRIGIEPESWIESVTKFHQYFYYSAGSAKKMEVYHHSRQALNRARQASDSRNSYPAKETLASNNRRATIRGILASRRLFG